MVNPKDEIYKRHFASSSFFTLVLCCVSQIILPQPLSYIPIISVMVLAFGYIWGKWHVEAWSSGAFVSSLGATAYFYLSGSSKESIVILGVLMMVLLGISMALPSETDWDYIQGWRKE